MGCGASAPVPEKKLFNFRVRLIGGLNLYNNGFGVQAPGTKTSATRFDGASDAYVQLECSGSKQFFESKTILHNQNPTWNEEFYFRTDTKAPVLKLTVKDREVIGSNTVLGTASVPLHGLITKTEEREMWVPLAGSKAKGEVGLAVVECYRTTLTLIQGVDVKPMDTLSGSSDCYVTSNIGQQERQKTEVKGWTLNPRWNEKFTFFVPYGLPSTIELIMWDRDRVGVDQNMGWYYHHLTGKPAPAPVKSEVKIQNAQGTLQFELADDDKVEVADAPAPTAEQIKAFPSKVPTTFSFEVRVLGAFNLAAADGCFIDDWVDEAKGSIFHEFRENPAKSDPFARVECEGVVYDTAHVNNTLEPTWNEKFRFIATDREKSNLKVSIWDHDLLDNDCIGSLVLPLNQLKPGQRQEIWSFLDKGRGEVGVELVQNVMLKVRVLSAEGLPAKDLNGMCDPYVKLMIGGQEAQTRVVRDSRNPTYDEDFRFLLPTVQNVKAHIQVFDSDLMIFKKGLSEDVIGGAEFDLEKLVPGVPTTVTLPIAHSGKAQGTLKLQLTNEVPLPPSAWDDLAKKGEQAFNDAVAKLNSTKDFIATLSPANFDKKEEAVVQPSEPKISNRPRFSRVAVQVIATRGVKASSVPIYVGVSIPSQGARFKTREYRQIPSCDINEAFTFGVPTKLTGQIDVSLFESNRHPFPATWCNENAGTATLKFGEANGGDGLIRGSPSNDTWMRLNTGGDIVIRVTEMFRFNVRVKSGENITSNTNPYVVVRIENSNFSTSVVPKDPAKDRTTGVPGKPLWDEQFTFFSATKGNVSFRLLDDTVVGNDTELGKGTFNLSELRRGVPMKDVKVALDKGGFLICDFLEEEKMALLDKLFDDAANAAKLAKALADEAAEGAKKLAGEAAASAAAAVGSVGAALGGLFGK
jgi:Ca2+-dependent lipid-binding protein